MHIYIYIVYLFMCSKCNVEGLTLKTAIYRSSRSRVCNRPSYSSCLIWNKRLNVVSVIKYVIFSFVQVLFGSHQAPIV